MSEAMEETEGQHTSGLQQNGKDFAQCQRIKWNACPYAILSMSAGAREEQNQDHDPPRSDLFLFPDESGNLTQDSSPTYPILHSPLITPVPNLAQEADDFCILETPGSRQEVRTATFLDSQQRQSVIISVVIFAFYRILIRNRWWSSLLQILWKSKLIISVSPYVGVTPATEPWTFPSQRCATSSRRSLLSGTSTAGRTSGAQLSQRLLPEVGGEPIAVQICMLQ